MNMLFLFLFLFLFMHIEYRVLSMVGVRLCVHKSTCGDPRSVVVGAMTSRTTIRRREGGGGVVNNRNHRNQDQRQK